MLDSMIALSLTIAAIGAGLMAGVYFAFSGFIMRSLNQLDAVESPAQRLLVVDNGSKHPLPRELQVRPLSIWESEVISRFMAMTGRLFRSSCWFTNLRVANDLNEQSIAVQEKGMGHSLRDMPDG